MQPPPRDEQAMQRAFAGDLTAHGLLKPDDAVVVGVSGGPDSMALLHLLYRMQRQGESRLRLHVAHFNHLLRGADSEADAAFVHAAADSLGLPCTVERRDIGALAGRGEGSVEEVARNQRYAFFARVCMLSGSRVVAVGHQGDDNAETILHRIFRGTGLRGLSGIPRSRPLEENGEVRLIRPLLSFTRQDVLRFLADAGVAYREDRTNASKEPMRNRIRQLLMPVIEAEVNPQVRDALLRLGEQAQWLEEFLSETVQRTFDTLVISRNDQTLVLNADVMARKSRIVQTELVRLAYRCFGLGEQNLAFAHLVSCLDLLSDSSSGRQAVLPGGMSIEKRYHQLIFSLPADEPREEIADEIAIHVPGRTVLPRRRLELECALVDVQESDVPLLRKRGERDDEHVDFDAVRPPLIIRSRRNGDRFTPLGAPGSKKLSDFLSDEKIEPRDRDRVAVVCDQLGPIWVIGHRIDDRVKLTAMTRRAIRMRATRLDGVAGGL